MNIFSFITMLAALGTLSAAIVAAVTYLRNARLERARWALDLYEKFYEQPLLKEVREILDNEPDSENIVSLVLKCPADFTDYLNFFEFVAFLEQNKQLTRNEVKALFDYYIKCLKRHPRVIKFIEDNGYENLNLLLEQWK